jgi:hypothetical protein
MGLLMKRAVNGAAPADLLALKGDGMCMKPIMGVRGLNDCHFPSRTSGNRRGMITFGAEHLFTFSCVPVHEERGQGTGREQVGRPP